MIRRYPPDSPEAVARVLAMAMLTDAAVDDRELDLLERLDLLREIGLDRDGFSRVVADYRQDVGAAEAGPTQADAAVVDAVIAAVNDPRKRLTVAAMMLSLCYADGRYAPGEVAVMRRVLQRWGLALESLQAFAAGSRRPAARADRPVARHLRRERRWGEEVGGARRRDPSLAD